MIRTIISALATSVVGFWDNDLLSKRKIWLFESSPLLGWVVLSPAPTVHIVVSFEPLYEFEVVLVLGPGDFLHLSNSKYYINMPLDSEFIKSGLKNLKIADELIVEFGFPVNLVHRDFARVYDV